MATWCVYHLIHVRVPHQHIPVLVIADVPDGEVITRELLERAGYMFGEFGIPWANHAIVKVDRNAPTDLIARIKRGEGERITYHRLIELANEPV